VAASAPSRSRRRPEHARRPLRAAHGLPFVDQDGLGMRLERLNGRHEPPTSRDRATGVSRVAPDAVLTRGSSCLQFCGACAASGRVVGLGLRLCAGLALAHEGTITAPPAPRRPRASPRVALHSDATSLWAC
jgi:hypothetical protein